MTYHDRPARQAGRWSPAHAATKAGDPVGLGGADPQRMAHAIRFLALDAVERVGEGHPGAPLGCADLATALFTRHLKFNPRDPLWFDRDRFVLSNGHGSMLLYALLHLSGYEAIGLDQIMTFRELGSHCAGHPEYMPQAGIETTTGALGQGIANAVGMAVAEAWLCDHLGPELVNHRTFAIVGDGCLQEGVGQEVISLAGHLQLGKLCFLWDDNQITDDGPLSLAQSDDMQARFRLSGWHVQSVEGHDQDAVSAALDRAAADPRPSMIACRTTIGLGLGKVEGRRAAHSGRVTADDVAEARARFNWPYPAFATPDETLEAWRAAGRRSLPRWHEWQRRVAALDPGRRHALDRLRAGELPAGWRDSLRARASRACLERVTSAGIQEAGDIVAELSARIPELLSGAPDLEGSTKHKGKLKAFTAQNRSGRYIHYGVREHAMGAMLNGMAAHGGILPVGATYLAFSDYARPALRSAALMGLPVRFVFSHDSIGIGRNGPTHQPVEILAALRAIPNMLVLRPADAVETAECWEASLDHRTGPSALIVSRQPLPCVRDTTQTGNLSARGAYVLAEAAGGARRVTLVATGSEVAIALAARQLLQAEGIPAAVVSMPCWSLFDAQDDAYRRSVLGPGTVRVAVEAAVRLGWDRYLGESGAFVGMNGFGASGHPDDLFRHFGITPEAVAEAARRRL